MDFKGTNKKWVKNGKNAIHTEEGNCVALTYNENREYDAQLISKAPEMLQKLKDLYNDLRQGALPNEKELKELDKLIKEATEL